MNRRIHISPNKIERLRPTVEQTTHVAPRGLWYSIGCDCKRRGADGQWDAESRKYEYELKLTDDVKLLVIDSLEAAEQVEMRWGVPNPIGGYYSQVRWDEIAAEYDGIEVFPWFDGLDRKDPKYMWYHGFSCSSGCVWNRQMLHLTLSKS